jgi:hypothetical protein
MAMACSVSVTVPIWLSLISAELPMPRAMARVMMAGLVQKMSSPTSSVAPPRRAVSAIQRAEFLDLGAGDHVALLSGARRRVVRDLGPGHREEHGLMPVTPADEVRRRAVGPVDPDDLCVTILVAPVDAPDRQFVSHLCSHGDLLLRSSAW